MLCPKCQTENPQGAKFCRSCGQPLSVSEETASQPVSPHPQPVPPQPPKPQPLQTQPPQETDSKATSLGLSQNATGALCYLGGPVTGIIFLLLETKNQFVRFHALQSTIVFGGLLVLRFCLNFLPFSMWQFRSFINLVVNLAGFIFWIVLMVKAYQGERYQLPIIGEIAQKQTRS